MLKIILKSHLTGHVFIDSLHLLLSSGILPIPSFIVEKVYDLLDLVTRLVRQRRYERRSFFVGSRHQVPHEDIFTNFDNSSNTGLIQVVPPDVVNDRVRLYIAKTFDVIESLLPHFVSLLISNESVKLGISRDGLLVSPG